MKAAAAEWFTTWFDSPYYHQLYAHRDLAEAARFVDALIGRLDPPAGAAMLDLGCGAGRHARRLSEYGFDVTGLDLSGDSIRLAAANAHARLRFARHDMREPFGTGRFDCILNLFTSFGYFDRAEEHLAVVRNISAALKRGGVFVLDYLNVALAEAHSRPCETIERGGVRYAISRRSDAAHLFKAITVEREGATTLAYEEKVARFSRGDLVLMLALYGLTVEAVYGDYALQPFDEQSSPRLILIARKTGSARDGDYLRDRRDSLCRTRLSVSGETPR